MNVWAKTICRLLVALMIWMPYQIATAGMIGSDLEKHIIGNTPFGRLGEPEDIANGVLFFVAEEASWVTGQVISIDGGHSIF